MLAVLLTPPACQSRTPIKPGGLSIGERQRRLARAAGATRIIVVEESGSVRDHVADTIVIADTASLATVIDGDPVLFIAGGLVLDARIVAVVVSAVAPAIGIWPAAGPMGRAGIERVDATSVFAGIALYPAAMVRQVAADLGEWDLASTLLRTALIANASRIDLSSLADPVSLVWVQHGNGETGRETTEMLMATARRTRPGWPARLVYPQIEAAAVRALLSTPIPSAAVRGLMLVLIASAAFAFVTGWLAVGLSLALVCGPVGEIAGRLERIRLEEPAGLTLGSRFHCLVDLGWGGAIVAGFILHDGGLAPWTVGTILIGFGLAERLQRSFFQTVAGSDLDDAGRLEHRVGLIAARRETLLWMWLPFGIVGEWYAGFVVLAIYAMLSFFFVQWRTMLRLRRNVK